MTIHNKLYQYLIREPLLLPGFCDKPFSALTVHGEIKPLLGQPLLYYLDDSPYLAYAAALDVQANLTSAIIETAQAAREYCKPAPVVVSVFARRYTAIAAHALVIHDILCFLYTPRSRDYAIVPAPPAPALAPHEGNILRQVLRSSLKGVMLASGK